MSPLTLILSAAQPYYLPIAEMNKFELALVEVFCIARRLRELHSQCIYVVLCIMFNRIS